MDLSKVETNRTNYTCIRLNNSEQNQLEAFVLENNKKKSVFLRKLLLDFFKTKANEG